MQIEINDIMNEVRRLDARLLDLAIANVQNRVLLAQLDELQKGQAVNEEDVDNNAE